jgi:hypothetical protein
MGINKSTLPLPGVPDVWVELQSSMADIPADVTNAIAMAKAFFFFF